MIISTLLRCYALVVLLLCLPGFAHASIGQSALGTVSGAVEYAMPDWFKDSFLDIQEDINAANSQHKHVMLFFHLNECPYCQKMLADSFSTEPLQTLIQQHFDVIAINTKGDREITFTDGTILSEKALAQQLKVQYTPTILFMDAQRKVVARLNGYRAPQDFTHVLNYVKDAAYQHSTLEDYLAQQQTQIRYVLRDNPLFQPVSDFSALKTPLAVVFEDSRCSGCDHLHDKLLNRTEVQAELKPFTVVRLDADSTAPITDPAGKPTTPKEWVKQLGLSYRPGIILFDKGKEVTRIDGLLYSFHFKEVFRYVSGQFYQQFATYNAYLVARQAELLDQGINIDIADREEAAATGVKEALPPEQAFAFAEPSYDGQALHLHWNIAPHHYLYRGKLVARLHTTEGVSSGEVQLPSGKVKHDDFFGEVEALYDQADISIPLQRSNTTQPARFQLEVGWQGCAEGLVCYPPETKVFEAVLPAVSAGQAVSTPSMSLKESASAEMATEATPFAVSLLVFLGLGLLLAFTPCVFPMIPILSGIIVGQQDLTPRKAFSLSLVYVLAMAVTYTLAGILAALFGENLPATFQNPWVIGAFSSIFVLLALSMFGFYELQMPAALQLRLNALSNRQTGGSLLGVAIMGMLSALIVGPCIAPPLAAALLYIGQSGEVIRGGMQLFTLSIGMGIPLLLVGTSLGKWLPKSGAWMETVRAVFGVLLLGVAIWMLERVLPAALVLPLWATLLVISAVFMGALSHLPEHSSGWRKCWQGVGILLLVHGSLLLVGSAGGGTDLLHPLRGLMAGQTQMATGLTFTPVQSVAGLQQALADARGKPVMLDIYADWCVSCKEMEEKTYPAPAVQSALQGAVLLKVDVTQNTTEDKALLRQLGLFGPPAVLFFGSDGKERETSRQVGFVAAEAFAAAISKALR